MEYSLIVLLVHTGVLYLNLGPRTVYGKDAAFAEFPFMASIQLGRTHICGGSILTNRTILTAAHCLEAVSTPNLLRVCVGSNNLKGGECYEVSQSLLHRGYNGLEKNWFNHDLALLTLETPLVFSKIIKPIHLGLYLPENETPLTVVGWGTSRSEMLQKAQSDYISNKSCKRIRRGIFGRIYLNIHYNQFCFLNGPVRLRGPCTVTSGSAILYRKNLVGVVSSGTNQCIRRMPSVAVGLRNYFLWITRNVH